MENLLKEILTQTTADPTFTPLEVKLGTETLYTHSQIFDQFAYNYSSYTLVVSSVYQPTIAFFVNLWHSYVDETAAQLQRQLEAMAAEYDPISNYDLTERSADARSQGKQTDTMTPSGGTQTVNDLKKSGLGSTYPGADSDQSTVTVTPLAGTKTETERTFTHDQTATVGSDTLSGNDVNEHILRRFGNVGVTQNAQMITNEIELRKISLLRNYVHSFVCRYCFAIGGESHDCFDL